MEILFRNALEQLSNDTKKLKKCLCQGRMADCLIIFVCFISSVKCFTGIDTLEKSMQ